METTLSCFLGLFSWIKNFHTFFSILYLDLDLSYPAHNSAFKGDLAYLQMVIETGVASVNERDERNSTPLHKGK